MTSRPLSSASYSSMMHSFCLRVNSPIMVYIFWMCLSFSTLALRAIHDAPSINLALSWLPELTIVSMALKRFFSSSFSSTKALLWRSSSFSTNYSFPLNAWKFSFDLWLLAVEATPIEALLSLWSRFFLSLIISTECSLRILAISLILYSFKIACISPKKSSKRSAADWLPLVIFIILSR